MLILLPFLFALTALMWSVVLVDDGMLLAPVQARLRRWHGYENGGLDARWWWKPLWGCLKCVSGQMAFWGYMLFCWHYHLEYKIWHHFLIVDCSIFFSTILNKVYQWTQTN